MRLSHFPDGSQGIPGHHFGILFPLGLPKGSPGIPLICLHLDFWNFLPKGSPGIPAAPGKLLKVLDSLNPWGSPGRFGIYFGIEIFNSLAPGLPREPQGIIDLLDAFFYDFLNFGAQGSLRDPGRGGGKGLQ